jgi:cobalt-zinc-cadmium resistance protein CzcA
MSVVVANVVGRDLVSFVEEAKRIVAEKVTLPAGYSLAWGSQFENQQRAAKTLAIVVPVALLLIFLLLFSTFQSVRQALLVLSNVPFALVGCLMAYGGILVSACIGRLHCFIRYSGAKWYCNGDLFQ